MLMRIKLCGKINGICVFIDQSFKKLIQMSLLRYLILIFALHNTL